MKFGNDGLIIEIIIREASGAKIESHKFKLKDKTKSRIVLNLLRKKYGFNDFIKKDKDIEWLGKNSWE